MAWALPRAAATSSMPSSAASPALVSVSFGDYAPYVDELHAAGCAVVTQVGSVEQALRAEDAGVDFVVSRGSEGGGHGFDLAATLPLLQAVLERVDVPGARGRRHRDRARAGRGARRRGGRGLGRVRRS